MATTISAIFQAKEEISEALDRIAGSAMTTDQQLGDLDREIQELSGSGDLTAEAFNKLRNAVAETDIPVEKLQDGINDINFALESFQAENVSAEQAMDQFRRGLNKITEAGQITDESLASLEREVDSLARSGLITNRAARNLKTTLGAISKQSFASSEALDMLTRSATDVTVGTMSAKRAADKFATTLASDLSPAAIVTAFPLKALDQAAGGAARAMDEGSDQADEMSRSLGILGAIASTSAFQFGSLSVNIGPFNLALRNLLTQLPPIIAGMGSLLAMVSALTGAFITLATVTGLLLAGGAIAFFEEFSAQFEESAEAMEALMGAVRDLLFEALRPLATQNNIDLFIGAINGAARVLNRFAQFADQMRKPVVDFIDSLDVDIDTIFESMHDTFMILRPILRGFIEFFLDEFPRIMMFFSEFTVAIQGDVMTILNSFGRLVIALLRFTDTVLEVLGPVLGLMLDSLTLVFRVLNSFPDIVVIAATALTILMFVIFKLISAFASLTVSMRGTNYQMIGQATSGSLLATVYGNLIAAAITYTTTQKSLLAITKALIYNIWSEIKAIAASTVTKVRESLATAVLVESKRRLVAWTKSLAIWSYIEAAASKALAGAKYVLAGALGAVTAMLAAESAGAAVASGVMSLYSAVTTAASAATWLLNAALAVLTSPILLVVGAVVLLISILGVLIDIFTGGAISGAIGDFFGGIIDWIMGVVDAVKSLLGLTGSPAISGDIDTGDIATDSNVDLSFEDNLEQNMDVNADPEEKEQIKRVVKDAMNEANSIARRRQGHSN